MKRRPRVFWQRGRPPANAGLEARRMNAQMSKHRVEPPAPMFFDGTETTTGQTGPNFIKRGRKVYH